MIRNTNANNEEITELITINAIKKPKPKAQRAVGRDIMQIITRRDQI